MNSPSQALLWSGFKLSWPALLTQISAVISVVFLTDLALDPGVDTRQTLEATVGITVAGLAFLYVVTLSAAQKIGRVTSALGFPFRTEYALPVSTLTLLVVPLLYYCLLFQLAVFIPVIILNFLLLDAKISFLAISFVVFQFTSFALMLNWWTRNWIECLIAWLVVLTLYVNGFLVPEFSHVDNTLIYIANSGTDYILPLTLTLAMLALTYFGVRQQRSGESLIEFGNNGLFTGETLVLRNAVPVTSPKCPIESPLKAEYWKERQLNGEYNAVFGGLVGAGMVLAIFSLINFFEVNQNSPDYADVMILIMAIYLAVCTGLVVYMFGVRYKNGAAYISVHDKTAAIGTAKLAAIRVSVSLSSILIAGLVMGTILWILGPIFINGFQEMKILFLGSFETFSRLSLPGLVLRIVLLVTAFFTALVLFATFLSWFMLNPRKISIFLTVIPLYGFLLAIFLAVILGENENYDSLLDSVMRNHLWLVVFLVPVSIATMLRELLRDWVITSRQMAVLLIAGTGFQCLNLVWLFGANNYGALQVGIGVAEIGYLIIQGFFPLLTAILVLWTGNRIRHG